MSAPGMHAGRWVTAQIPLLTITIVLPVAQWMLHAPRPWIEVLAYPARALGLLLLVLAIVVFRAAQRALGPALVATPRPVPGARLRQDGVYGRVRHPIYAALLAGALGWALLWTSVDDLGLVFLCTAFFLAKLRYEESLLRATFPQYEAYSATVPALFPLRRR